MLHRRLYECTRRHSDKDKNWKKLDIKSQNKPFIKKDKPRGNLKPNKSNINEHRKCHECAGIGHLAKINEIVETEDHNDKEEEFDSEKGLKNQKLLKVMKLIELVHKLIILI
ncbi:hypothetical protein O181_094984 [Austropuccinia psidii MF-1]|uniref:Uncharacterized protein n=1 Tax=Austropuccinia psidii MF-1 TaxID=1389203 RepID=A0A9Q3J478_9BASI|nr:hypothetical protein [Austropuccinia psidii MF-1]